MDADPAVIYRQRLIAKGTSPTGARELEAKIKSVDRRRLRVRHQQRSSRTEELYTDVYKGEVVPA